MTHLPRMPVENIDRVLVGDCIELMRALPEASVDMVFADPPYGPLDVDALLGGTKAQMAIIENDRFASAPAGWTVQKEKRYGTTLVTVLVVDGEDAS